MHINFVIKYDLWYIVCCLRRCTRLLRSSMVTKSIHMSCHVISLLMKERSCDAEKKSNSVGSLLHLKRINDFYINNIFLFNIFL